MITNLIFSALFVLFRIFHFFSSSFSFSSVRFIISIDVEVILPSFITPHPRQPILYQYSSIPTTSNFRRCRHPFVIICVSEISHSDSLFVIQSLIQAFPYLFALARDYFTLLFFFFTLFTIDFTFIFGCSSPLPLLFLHHPTHVHLPSYSYLHTPKSLFLPFRLGLH